MSRKAKDMLRCEALSKYLAPGILATSNVVSALSRAFVECFLECIEEGCGISYLSRFTSLFDRGF